VLHLADVLKYDENKKNALTVEMLDYLNTVGKYSVYIYLKMISTKFMFVCSLQAFFLNK